MVNDLGWPLLEADLAPSDAFCRSRRMAAFRLARQAEPWLTWLESGHRTPY
jgi:hypothetical protein